MRRLGLLAVAVVVCLPLVVSASAYGVIKVGVVDLVEVTNNFERTKDASADLQVEQANLKAASEPKVKALEDIRLKRDGFNKGTKEWEQLDEQTLKTEVELRNWLGMEQVKIERRHRDVLLEMYREIAAVTERLAKQKGLDMVFTQAFLSPPQIDVDKSKGLEDLKNRIIGQRIIYPTDVTELTQDVLKILNAEYKAKKPAGDAKADTPKPKADEPKPKG
ncbi:MAG: OmpH family outer membrane protein [Planctomycetes bacterium]|nr:OmpH family outer membrane protein [Planctomycetota bacterium]